MSDTPPRRCRRLTPFNTRVHAVALAMVSTFPKAAAEVGVSGRSVQNWWQDDAVMTAAQALVERARAAQ